MDLRDSHSCMEKNFQTQQTFKRNSRYYNVPEILKAEETDSIIRRSPIPKQEQSQEIKIDKSFTNSTAILSNRTIKEMDKYKRRVSGDSPKSQYEKQYSSPNSPKLKSFSIEKMLSRKQVDQTKIKPVHDERQFNNFQNRVPDLSKTSDFSKLRGRSLDFKLDHINDLYHDSKKPHQFCFYKPTTMKTKVRYQIQNKEKKRYFFIPKRSTDLPSTVMNPQKVDNGAKIATNYKTSNILHNKIAAFYLSHGKEKPSQYDNRYMTQLTNFYRDGNDKLVQPHVDFLVKKFKEDLIAKKKEAIQMAKNNTFERDEVCDEKYFKQQLAMHRKGRMSVC